MPFRIVPLSADLAARVRAAREDGHGNRDLTPVVADSDDGFPCRVCLRDAAAGEELLLFSHAPFARPVPYQTVGPIFVHAAACAPYTPGPLPELLRRRLLAVRAYDGGDRLLTGELVEGAALDGLADRLFADGQTRTIHVHSARSGCWLCALVPSDRPGAAAAGSSGAAR